jgi:hypothetical protein
MITLRATFKGGRGMRYLSGCLSVILFCVASWASAQAAPAVDEGVDEVLVTGEQPGPSLWAVYKGDHVMWIMGTLSPLPKSMQWRSSKVMEIVANSQEFLRPADVKLQVGFWGKVSILPSLVGIKNNPKGQTLKDVLPNDVYTRWLGLKEKYMEDNAEIERKRPIVAATELFNASIEHVGMVKNNSIRWAVEAVVRERGIKTTHPIVDHQLQNPHATVKKFKQSSLSDVECFAKTIERLETDLDGMRARANAWATGDLALLRSLPYQDEQSACEAAVLSSEVVQEQGLQDIKEVLAAAWLAAAELALDSNTQTFALLPMNELFDPKGYLSLLAAKGYRIDRPLE